MKRILVIGLLSLMVIMVVGAIPAAAEEEFPQRNAWYQATPSVVWCGDETSTTSLEVHIVGRNDVARVWFTDLGTTEEEGRAELFDDGTHGDLTAGDNIFTLGDLVIPCQLNQWFDFGWDVKWMMLRVELNDGTQTGNNYGMTVGMVDPAYKDKFEVLELAPGIKATAYAVFLEDSAYEVMDNYPVSSVYCGTSNFAAYQKLYSVFGDDFDFASIMPGMLILRPEDLAENVPYNVLVSNNVQNIGIDIFDNTAQFGSAGRLKSVTYQSFGTISIFEHEIAHTWGAAIGQPLGLLSPKYTWDVNQGHWNENADMEGQLGSYYFDDMGNVGHFSYQGDETWKLIPNIVAEPYSPLELYTMGFIPPEEVPPVHILNSPDLTDIDNITAESYETVMIEDIIASEGGPRVPSSEESQKDFSLAFIVTQDMPYDGAAYSFFSLMSYQLTSKDEPSISAPSLAPFYWATGGRATIETLLPLDLEAPLMPGQTEEVVEEETEEVEETEEAAATAEPTEDTEEEQALVEEQDTEEEGVEEPVKEKTPFCNLLPVGILLAPPLVFRLKRRKKS